MAHEMQTATDNPFDAIYERVDARVASLLAQAFCSANDYSELHAILRFSDATATKNSPIQDYVNGACFPAYDWSDDHSVFLALKEIAIEFRDECSKAGLWRA